MIGTMSEKTLSRRKLLLVIGVPPGVDAVTRTPPSAAGSQLRAHLRRYRLRRDQVL